MSGLRILLCGALLAGAVAFGGLSAGVAAGAQAADEPPPEPSPGEPTVVLGAPSAFDLGASGEGRLQVAAGTRVRERPDPGAGALAIVDAAVELAVVERRGEWVRVRYGGLGGWIWDGDGPEPEAAPSGAAGESAAPARGDQAGSEGLPGAGAAPSVVPSAERPVVRSYGPDPDTVERARTLLSGPARELPAGPWRLLTDVEDARLLASLDRLAGELPAAYRELFGLPVALGALAGGGGPEGGAGDRGASRVLVAAESAGEPPGAEADRELIVLFSNEQAYRTFLGGAAASGPDGYTTNGMSILYRGDLENETLRGLFVHELVHLLDWRVFEGRTPAWLEEGLAQAMAMSRIEPSGALHARELDDAVQVVSESFSRTGRQETILRPSAGYGAIRAVAQGLRRSEVPTLEALVARDPTEATDPDRRALRYFHCALVVRYLLQADNGRWREGFQAYLADLARRAPGEDGAGELPAALGTDWDSLEQGFSKWVRTRDLRLAGPRQITGGLSQRLGRRAGPSIEEPNPESPGARAAEQADPAERRDPEPDPARLARALELLGHPQGLPVGPWTLYSDVHGRRLLRSLDLVASETVRAYRELFALDPGLLEVEQREPAAADGGGPSSAGQAREVVILFARPEEHDAFLGDEPLFDAGEIGGAAGFGMAVLHKGQRSADELRALLVHELVHLLSRRALGARTPPWLEEGLADALAFSRITPAGRLHAEDLGGKTETWQTNLHGLRSQPERTVLSTGPLAAIDRLVSALDRRALPPLESLTTMSWDTLVDPRWRQLRYAQSAMFVRFLLDAEEGRYRRGFQSYLQEIAGGGDAAAGSNALLAALGTDWETLERSFGRWVRSEQIAARME